MQDVCIAVMPLMLSIRHHLNQGASVHLGIGQCQFICCCMHAGRTGRAGRTGVCVTLVGRNKEGLIPFIEKRAGVKFERTGAPQPADMAKVAGV